MERSNSDGGRIVLENYQINDDGVIYQVDKEPISYGEDYVKNSYVVYEPLPTYMGYLRLGNIIGSIGKVPDSILDVGYGNGSFLKVCKDIVSNCYGFDVTNYPVPEGCNLVNDLFSESYDVITFFDSLEHFENIEFVKDLKCNYVCVSVPNCHYKDDEWFRTWKHRRPNEHLWHFNQESLSNFMKRMGYTLISSSNIEDTIRKNNTEDFNILTSVFKK